VHALLALAGEACIPAIGNLLTLFYARSLSNKPSIIGQAATIVVGQTVYSSLLST